MTQAYENFKKVIDEVEELEACYGVIENETPYHALRVLKRAVLIMTLTAWETYVEDVAEELIQKKLALVNDSLLRRFVEKSFRKTHKQLNTPNFQISKQLFEEFLGIDVTEKWVWPGFDQAKVKETLSKWIKKRGEAVHRLSADDNSPDIVERVELIECIKFSTELVKATESALEHEV